jgi:hypothetical protein
MALAAGGVMLIRTGFVGSLILKMENPEPKLEAKRRLSFIVNSVQYPSS